MKRRRQRLKPFFHADTKRLTHLRTSLYGRANCPQNFVAKFRRKTPLVVLRENSRTEKEREREKERDRLRKFAKNRYETVTVLVKIQPWHLTNKLLKACVYRSESTAYVCLRQELYFDMALSFFVNTSRRILKSLYVYLYMYIYITYWYICGKFFGESKNPKAEINEKVVYNIILMLFVWKFWI